MKIMARKIRQVLILSGDIFLIYFALGLTLKIRFWQTFNFEVLTRHLIPFSLLYLFWFLIFCIFGLYDFNLVHSKINFYSQTGFAFLVCFTVGLIFFYLTPIFAITPKTNLFLNIAIFGILFLIWRKIFYSLSLKHFLNRVAILGKNVLSQNLAKEIEARPYLGYKIVKFLTFKNIFSEIKEEKINTLIISENIVQSPKLAGPLYKCLPLRIDFLDVAQAYETVCQKIPIAFINQVWFLENLKEGEKQIYDNIKRITDIVLAAIIIGLTSPLWLLFSLLIKLEDKGPVFYKQQRVKKDGKIFWLYKFRSMKPDAEKGKAIWAQKEDPRITKIGNILRKTHLDELPQMLNIIKSDISLVGPRPERPEFVKKLEKEIPYYHLRHIIRPGFSGWAQIKFRYGRSIEDSFEKFQYDLYYIKNRSFFLDLGILFKTFQLLFKGEKED